MKALILISLITTGIQAQFTTIDWEKTFGSTQSEVNHTIALNGPSGYLIANDSRANDGTAAVAKGGADVWVASLDLTGNINWQTTIGGTLDDFPKKIIKGTDNAIYVVGYSKSTDQDIPANQGDDDILLVKLDLTGNLIWAKTYGGSARDRGETILQKPNGNLLIAALSMSSNGDISSNYGSFDYIIMELDTAGNIIWEKNYGGSGTDQVRDIKKLLDGNYIMTGLSTSSNFDANSNNGSYDYLTIKFNDTGLVIWSDAEGGSGLDYAEGILPLPDSSIIVAGYSGSKNFDVDSVYSGNDIWIIKYDKNGTILWKEIYGGNADDALLDIIQLNNGDVYGIGTTSSSDGQVSSNYGSSDVWLINIATSNGSLISEKNYGGSSTDQGYELLENSTNDIVMMARSSSNTNDVTTNIGGSDSWVVKLNPSSTSIYDLTNNEISFFPNPASNTIVIETNKEEFIDIRIHDLQGKLLLQENNNSVRSLINVSDFKNGTYFLSVLTKDGAKKTYKLIIQH